MLLLGTVTSIVTMGNMYEMVVPLHHKTLTHCPKTCLSMQVCSLSGEIGARIMHMQAVHIYPRCSFLVEP